MINTDRDFQSEDPDELPNHVPSDVVVSVCIITYQHARYIAQALDSVLAQSTGFPFEILIGEDDSSDGTREICMTYAKRYPSQIRLFLRRDQDKIYTDGRKTGKANGIKTRRACRGKYIALLEGDDLWSDPAKLRLQFEMMEKNPDMVLCGHNTIVVSEDLGRIEKVYNIANAEFVLERGGGVGQTHFHTSSFFLRSGALRSNSVFEKINPHVFNGDTAMYWTMSLLGRIGYLPRFMSYKRLTRFGVYSRFYSERKGYQIQVNMSLNTSRRFLAAVDPTYTDVILARNLRVLKGASKTALRRGMPLALVKFTLQYMYVRLSRWYRKLYDS